MIQITLNGAKNLAKWLDDTGQRSRRALSTALKIEGFRLMRVLKEEVRRGAPGGQPFAPLSYIAQWRGRRGGRDKPLARFATVVRYAADAEEVRIGFLNPARGRAKLSKRWLNLARMHQEGFWHDMRPSTRKALPAIGQRAPAEIRQYFHLRKSTRRFHTPARPVVVPFWRAHQAEALSNIRANFRRKIAGDRI
jgi:hypothetical protein